MRLIDADALFREMEKAEWYNNADRDEIAEEMVLYAPTIKPEIVRCKDCRHYNSHDHKCKVWNHGVILSGFCHEAMKGEKNETD